MYRDCINSLRLTTRLYDDKENILSVLYHMLLPLFISVSSKRLMSAIIRAVIVKIN